METLRKHILSSYASTFPAGLARNKTVQTASIEESDADENILDVLNILSGPTRITKSVESSDPDEFTLKDPTYLTHAIEESDPDEFICNCSRINTNFSDPTKHTYTIEASDEDEFLLM